MGDEYRDPLISQVRERGAEEARGQAEVGGKASMVWRVTHHQIETGFDFCCAIRRQDFAVDSQRGEIVRASGKRGGAVVGSGDPGGALPVGGERQQSIATAQV